MNKDTIYFISWIASMGIMYLGLWMFNPAVNEVILGADNSTGLIARFGLAIAFSGTWLLGVLMGHAAKSDDADKWKKIAEYNATKQDIIAG